MRSLKYKGGVSFVAREDEPTHQCTACYKPHWKDELVINPLQLYLMCPSCDGKLRELTNEQPLITK